MNDNSKLFEGFDEIEYTHKEAFDYLFAKAIANESFIQGLKEFVLNKLSDILIVPYDDLLTEYIEHCETYRKNAIADFLTKFGSV